MHCDTIKWEKDEFAHSKPDQNSSHLVRAAAAAVAAAVARLKIKCSLIAQVTNADEFLYNISVEWDQKKGRAETTLQHTDTYVSSNVTSHLVPDVLLFQRTNIDCYSWNLSFCQNISTITRLVIPLLTTAGPKRFLLYTCEGSPLGFLSASPQPCSSSCTSNTGMNKSNGT